MKTAILSRSNRPSKKFTVRVGNRTIHFGANGYEDFTIHKDPKRKARYLARHKMKTGITLRVLGFGQDGFSGINQL